MPVLWAWGLGMESVMRADSTVVDGGKWESDVQQHGQHRMPWYGAQMRQPGACLRCKLPVTWCGEQGRPHRGTCSWFGSHVFARLMVTAEALRSRGSLTSVGDYSHG